MKCPGCDLDMTSRQIAECTQYKCVNQFDCASHALIDNNGVIIDYWLNLNRRNFRSFIFDRSYLIDNGVIHIYADSREVMKYKLNLTVDNFDSEIAKIYRRLD